MCRSSSVGASISSVRVGRNPANVLPAPVVATSSPCRPARPTSSMSSWWLPRRPAARREPVGKGQEDRSPGTRGHPIHIGIMAKLGDWIDPRPHGIYRKTRRCVDRSLAPRRPGRSYARPCRSCARRPAMRYGPRPRRSRSWKPRYGPQAGHPVAYGEAMRLGDVDIRFVPAGHVLGSAQIVLETSRRDHRRFGRLQAPLRTRPARRSSRSPSTCFVTEATFGLPVFRHPDTGDEIDKLTAALHANPDRRVLVGAYALGKAQRGGIAGAAGTRVRRRSDLPPRRSAAIGCDLYVAHGGGCWASCAWRPACPRRNFAGASSWRHRARSTIAGRGGCPISIGRHGLGLDARPKPARGTAQCRAAADPVRPCRLGRADRRP